MLLSSFIQQTFKILFRITYVRQALSALFPEDALAFPLRCLPSFKPEYSAACNQCQDQDSTTAYEHCPWKLKAGFYVLSVLFWLAFLGSILTGLGGVALTAWALEL